MGEDTVAQCHRLIDRLTAEQATVALAVLRCIGQKKSAHGGPFGRLLAVEFTEWEAGRCTCAAEVGEHLWNPHRVAHGALAYALLDYAMGGAVVSLLTGEEANWRPVTLDIQIRYHQPVRRGRLSASAHVVQRGGRIVTLTGDAIGDGERLIATATGAFYLKRDA